MSKDARGGAGYSCHPENVKDCKRYSIEEVETILQAPIKLASGINHHSGMRPGTHKGTSKASGAYVSAVAPHGGKSSLHLSVHPSGRTDAVHVKDSSTGEEIALYPVYSKDGELLYFRRGDVGSTRAGNYAWGFAEASRKALMNMAKPASKSRRATRKLRKRSKSLKNH